MQGALKGHLSLSVLYFHRARLAVNSKREMNPFSVRRFPPVWLAMMEPGRKETGHGSLGIKPNGMIGVFMISFLPIAWLGRLSGKHSVTQVMLYSASFGKGQLKEGGGEREEQLA